MSRYPECGVEGCTKQSRTIKSLSSDKVPACSMYSERYRLTGSYDKPSKPDTTHIRFMESHTVDPNTGCWGWNRKIRSDGYVKFMAHGKYIYIHRYSYEYYVGPIPTDLTLDHLCKNRACCNPEHLEAVSFKENVLRGDNPCAINSRKTHCINGHEFSIDNTLINSITSSRACRICNKARYAKFYNKKRESKWMY